jgi:RHS repeat-associated protein
VGTNSYMRSYSYDSVGNRTLQVDLANNSTLYYYDTLYRLTTEQRIGTNAYTRVYAYDPAGNRTQMLILSNSTCTATYILNNLNQITASTTNGVETLYSYDANGNLLSEGSTSFVWNEDDQLLTVFLSNDTVNYLYDSLGRRSQRIHGNSTTNYQLEGLDTQIELDNSTVQRTYTLSGGLTGQIISVRYNNADYFYHYDAIGNVLFITDSTGAIVTAYTQEGFGNVIAGSVVNNNYHLTTKEQDPDSELYYFSARWYDPSVGRFISKDPIGFYGGINSYSYVGNNVLNFSDPMGTMGDIACDLVEEVAKEVVWEMIIKPAGNYVCDKWIFGPLEQNSPAYQCHCKAGQIYACYSYAQQKGKCTSWDGDCWKEMQKICLTLGCYININWDLGEKAPKCPQCKK